MSKNLFLEATPSEEEKPRENLEREIIVLKEALREKATEVGTILSENEELKERVEVLLKLLENHNIPAPCFPSRGSYSQSNRPSSETEDANKFERKSIFSTSVMPLPQETAVEHISKSLKDMESKKIEEEGYKFLFEKEECAANKEKEVEAILLEKEELKSRVKELEEGENLLIAHHDKENMPSPFFKPPSGSYLRIPLFPALKLHGQTSQSNRLSEQHFKDNHKYIGNVEDANKIKRKSIFSTSAMPQPQPQEDAMEKLSRILENIAPPPSYTSGEIPPLNKSSRITTNAFEDDKNIEDKEDTKKDLFSVEYKSFSSIGMKNTLTSENPDTHSCTGSTNGLYIPKCNNIPSLELPSSRSLESESSSKELCKEAWVAYYFPHLNISPPGTPNMFSEPFTYCEECKKVHYTYHYCYYKPCAACYSKEHHFINCPFLDFIPQGAVFNRDVFEVVCGCCSPFDQDEWFCSCCFGKSRVTKLKVKFCFLCLTIGHHNYYECPEDKVAADKHRSSREAKFNSAKARSLLPPTESYSTIKRDGWCRASAISRLQRT